MRKLLMATATLVLGNIAWFYAMKAYSDGRQVRVVSATLDSTVQLAAIAPIINRIPYVKFKGKKVVEVGYHYKRTGFGQINAATGVFVSNDGLILTCAHVTRGTRLLQVSLNGFVNDELAPKKVRKLFAYVVGINETADIALLRVIYPGQWFRGVSLRKDAPKGLPVFTIGDLNKNVTAGVISSYADIYTVTDVVIDHGSSGGGLYDADGKLVGLASYMMYPNDVPSYEGFSGFTDIKTMRELIAKYKGF